MPCALVDAVSREETTVILDVGSRVNVRVFIHLSCVARARFHAIFVRPSLCEGWRPSATQVQTQQTSWRPSKPRPSRPVSKSPSLTWRSLTFCPPGRLSKCVALKLAACVLACCVYFFIQVQEDQDGGEGKKKQPLWIVICLALINLCNVCPAIVFSDRSSG